ncbi:hypothetical protein LR48_Vigan10g109700 [Vigna angularis]|uniref:Uncharacterized protein n=1 Tax=Phaseolus angularis TaxID=3914 RepID=A0A0L9VJH9_PHAAN|nr:hypothetical protein LR48_Vigan10g109700 [Vigna angularis]
MAVQPPPKMGSITGEQLTFKGKASMEWKSLGDEERRRGVHGFSGIVERQAIWRWGSHHRENFLTFLHWFTFERMKEMELDGEEVEVYTAGRRRQVGKMEGPYLLFWHGLEGKKIRNLWRQKQNLAANKDGRQTSYGNVSEKWL